MSVALRQFEAMVAEQTRGLSDDEAARLRKKLMDNTALANYYSQEGKLFVTVGDEVVQTLTCERVALEYPRKDPDDPSHWQHDSRGQVNLARSRNGDLWAFMQDGPIFHSEDRGRSWTWTCGSSVTASKDFTFTILQDDTFLVVGSTEGNRSLLVHRSRDLGRTWECIATINPPAPYVVIQDDTPAMTQLSDGTILFTTQCAASTDWQEGRGHVVCRSTDHGMTWSVRQVTWEANRVTADEPEFLSYGRSSSQAGLICGESHILEVAGGKLLHTVRFQGLAEGPWEKVSKTACFLDSEDGGLTWQNARPALDGEGNPVLERGQCHGWSGQLPDGRIVMVHDHRYPYPQGQAIARVSHDGGKTWDRRAYHLNLGSGYPAILVLEDATIVTVSGAALYDDVGKPRASRNLWRSVAVRWKLPPRDD